MECESCSCVYSVARETNIIISNAHDNEFIGINDYQPDGNCYLIQ